MKKRLFGIVAVTAFAISAIGAPALAAVEENNGQKAVNVYICHFSKHDAGLEFGGHLALTGDYVMNPPAGSEGEPSAAQVAYCDTAGYTLPAGEGGRLIQVNANSLDGHGAQLQERVALYE